jgi:hypothetical protein
MNMETYTRILDILEGERLRVYEMGEPLTPEEAAARISNRLADEY